MTIQGSQPFFLYIQRGVEQTKAKLPIRQIEGTVAQAGPNTLIADLHILLVKKEGRVMQGIIGQTY